MLNNNFFKHIILQKSESGFTAEITLNAESDIYKGHFPDFPITPGVCQVQMVTEVLNAVLNSHYSLKTARDIKFLNLINPNVVLSLRLEVTIKQLTENDIAVNALINNDEYKFLKMRAVYGL